MEGTIAGLNEKGFGFIKVEGAAKDVFFHSKEVEGTTFDALVIGDKVTFEMDEGPKGPFAAHVNKV